MCIEPAWLNVVAYALFLNMTDLSPQPHQSEFFHYLRIHLMNNKKPVFKISYIEASIMLQYNHH